MQIRALLLLFGLSLCLSGEIHAAEPAGKSPCPSLDGDWSGQFDGSYSGDWSATFSQTGKMIRATASIALDSGVHLEAEGSAGISCEGNKTALAGTGSANKKSGSFSGISDDKGTHLSGTWWSGDLAGKWQGQRATNHDD